MNAGKLDQRVTLQALSGGVDEIGQPLPDTWTDVATVWAAVEPLAGREYIAAGAMVSAVETRIRLRYRPGVVSSMRVIHGDTVYGIEAVIHVKSARRELQLMCKAVA
jgi:SPP1 family predicted phage head-tail adaptor